MNKKNLSSVIGAAVVTSLAGSAVAAENPFAIKELDSGYQQVAEAEKESKEMVCGEGKCGGQAAKNPEMNCGAMKAEAEKKAAQQEKAMEGKCAGMQGDSASGSKPAK